MFLNWHNITISAMLDILQWTGALQFCLQESHPRCMVSPPPPLFGLVIGIDKYLSNGIRDLSGAVADANAVNTFLQKSLRIPKGPIKNLRNEEAMRVTIEMEIKDLGNNLAIKKDDPILIYYAGHGAEANALSRWPSTNRKIQMLVPHDFITSGSDDSERGQGLAAKKSDNIVRPSSLIVVTLARAHERTMMILLLPFMGSISLRFTLSLKTSCMTLSQMPGRVLLQRDSRRQVYYRMCSFQHQTDLDKFTYKDIITNLSDLPEQDPQCEVANPQRELYSIHASSDTPGQYIVEASEAHGITRKTQFVVFTDRAMTTPLGTVVVSNNAAFTSTCDFSAHGSEPPFCLAAPRFSLQTRVNEEQDVRFFIEPDKRLQSTFQWIADEMRSNKGGQRGFCLVQSRDDAPDLIMIADGDDVHFKIMDKLCRQHGLTHMPFKVKIDDSDTIRRVLQSTVDFYWYLHHSRKGSPLATSMLKCMKLKETGEYTDDLEEVLMPDPNGDNLNIRGVIMVDVDEDAIYGFKITNMMSVPLYVSMFYFDVSDLSISSYYQLGHAKKNADVSLPPHGSLTIGYGASGMVPHLYTLREGQDVDVGFLKLFFSTKYLDLSGIVQGSPFMECRGGTRAMPKSRNLWDTMCVAVVQKKGLKGT
ncbi:hypothetical protein EDD85DRAFT_792552 [Armillaria nabsnona]|nr:hypothetical protein EDD85DRAFT_792552 [Armillaria nabsnona]